MILGEGRANVNVKEGSADQFRYCVATVQGSSKNRL